LVTNENSRELPGHQRGDYSSETLVKSAKRSQTLPLLNKISDQNFYVMSSNIRVFRTCEYCEQEFTAKTVRSRYCSHTCNRKGYKKAERDEKLEVVNMLITVKPLNLNPDPVNWAELTRKPYLTVSEACLVLNVRVETLRRWIKEGNIKTTRLGKKHLISRGFLLNSQGSF
jgi:excisionase family DNA binding protein